MIRAGSPQTGLYAVAFAVVKETDEEFLFEKARRVVWWTFRLGLIPKEDMLRRIVIHGGKSAPTKKSVKPPERLQRPGF